MVVTAEEKRQIQQKGYADIGGLPKQIYWTPDGRKISMITQLRTYNIIENGKPIGSGIRDANLDNGWLLQKPEVLKPYCPHCDKWHDTEEQVKACGIKKKKFNAFYIKKALTDIKKDIQPNDELNGLKDKVSKIETDMDEIKSMLSQLLKGVK